MTQLTTLRPIPTSSAACLHRTDQARPSKQHRNSHMHNLEQVKVRHSALQQAQHLALWPTCGRSTAWPSPPAPPPAPPPLAPPAPVFGPAPLLLALPVLPLTPAPPVGGTLLSWPSGTTPWMPSCAPDSSRRAYHTLSRVAWRHARYAARPCVSSLTRWYCRSNTPARFAPHTGATVQRVQSCANLVISPTQSRHVMTMKHEAL